MGGNYPMPTLISKGPILVRLDAHYMDAADRLASLKRLRDQGLGVVASGQQGTNKSGDVLLTQKDVNHLLEDWFDPNKQWWNALKQLPMLPIWINASLTPDDLQAGKAIIHAALVYALEKSLGLARGDPAPSAVEGGPGAPLKPVKVSWICGKADGFEAQVIWSESEIHVYILTPPIRQALQPLAKFTDEQAASNDSAPSGMVLVTGKVTGGEPVTSISHIDLEDGGVAEGGAKPGAGLPRVPKTELTAVFATEIDDPGERLGNTAPGHEDGLARRVLDALREWFAQKDQAGRELSRLNKAVVRITHVTVGEKTLWASATVTGKHDLLDGADDHFLGWAPTGAEVEFKAIVQASNIQMGVTIDDVIWDRQSVHGQLGVKAVGRPVLREGLPTWRRAGDAAPL
jgi:hypothetical protein